MHWKAHQASAEDGQSESPCMFSPCFLQRFALAALLRIHTLLLFMVVIDLKVLTHDYLIVYMCVCGCVCMCVLYAARALLCAVVVCWSVAPVY